MNRFHLCFFIASLLFFSTLSVHAIRRSEFSGDFTGTKQVFQSSVSAPAARDFKSEKRKVPTGSNPLHNKRRYLVHKFSVRV
ncbi:unnamed protein product [Ilex paraguariensis]|uniref:Uncharacterized protein n=1 Tax=Ilex paraguariensis TaxID=185542 RepID=A0ABC8SE26_9AQUA